MDQSFHKFWLKITAIGVGFGGPGFFLATMPATEEVARWSLDLLSWPVDGAQTVEGPTMRFLFALSGGFLFGWGVLIWNLSGKVYDLAPEQVRQSVLIGLLAWFCLDSLGSVTSGHSSNVLFNVLVLLILVGPMWVPAREAN